MNYKPRIIEHAIIVKYDESVLSYYNEENVGFVPAEFIRCIAKYRIETPIWMIDCYNATWIRVVHVTNDMQKEEHTIKMHPEHYMASDCEPYSILSE